jgi:hypothetical protein
MTFFRKFLIAWRDAKLRQTYDELADHPEYWTKEDGFWLASMLTHPTGQKWMRRLNNAVIRSAIDATRRTLNPRYQCGVARGMALMKADIDRDYTMALTLAGAKSGNSETAEDERDAADLERLLSQ